MKMIHNSHHICFGSDENKEDNGFRSLWTISQNKGFGFEWKQEVKPGKKNCKASVVLLTTKFKGKSKTFVKIFVKSNC